MVDVVANEKATKEFVIPVGWEVFGKIRVQADTIEEAFEWAKEHMDEIPLDDDPNDITYVDGSYYIGTENVDECMLYN